MEPLMIDGAVISTSALASENFDAVGDDGDLALLRRRPRWRQRARAR